MPDTIFVGGCKLGMAGIDCVTSEVDALSICGAIPTSERTIEATLHNLWNGLYRGSMEKPFFFWTSLVVYHFCRILRIFLSHDSVRMLKRLRLYSSHIQNIRIHTTKFAGNIAHGLPAVLGNIFPFLRTHGNLQQSFFACLSQHQSLEMMMICCLVQTPTWYQTSATPQPE
jgi:hypothetical protein